MKTLDRKHHITPSVIPATSGIFSSGRQEKDPGHSQDDIYNRPYNRPLRSKAFTLIETLIATTIFLVVIVGSFALYRYLIMISVDSKNIAMVKNLQMSYFHAMEGVIKIEGWQNFFDQYARPSITDGTTPVIGLNYDTSTSKYKIVQGRQPIYPFPDGKQNTYWVEMQFETDSTNLGPYITEIATTQPDAIHNVYTINFSSPLDSSKITPANYRTDQLFSILNNPTHQWMSNNYTLSNDNTNGNKTTITITTTGDTTVVPGDIIRPTAKVVDKSSPTPLNDITLIDGVKLPDVGKSSKGYPQVIKMTVTIVYKDITGEEYQYRTSKYIRYEQ
jgi:hypothetical protein